MPALFDKLRFHLTRFRWMQVYYEDRHLRVTLPGCALSDGQGAVFGYLEEVQLHQGRLSVRGWAQVPRLAIRLGDAQVWCAPTNEREDVAQALGCDKNVGFATNLPFGEGPLLIEFDTPAGRVTTRHDMDVAKARQKGAAQLRWRFWRDTLPLLPMILRGLWRNDADLPRRIKAALRLGLPETELSLDRTFLAGEEETPPTVSADFVTLIMPVYNAFDLLPEALDRVMAHTDLPFRLIVIEDASPDPRVRPWLRDWVVRQGEGARIDLLENAQNLGFIGSVNRGFEQVHSRAEPGPVVLLNSDAMVPAAWASRLVAPLVDPAVASATPLSNDAEIFNVPQICVRGALAPGQGDAIDADLRARISWQTPLVATPTGVGFCMAMQRDWIKRIGSLDPVFGRGYGEEVDWCRRASGRGGRHVAVTNLFVEHRGGASFGPEKLTLIQKNNGVISTRYPGYDQLVQTFIRTDPLVTPRLVAALAWAQTLPDLTEIPVYIGHSMGGGAESYLQNRIRKDPVSVVIRLGGSARYRIELETPLGRLVANSNEADLVLRLFSPLTRRRIIYSCGVGDPDLAELPDFLGRLAEGAALDILFHDYLPISPSYTLLDHDTVYRGVPTPDTTDSAHAYRRPDGSVMSLTQWRAAWGAVIAQADSVQVFSQASAGIVTTAYPQARDRLRVTPHDLLHPVPRIEAPQTKRIVIGALGAIGPQKGAAVLTSLTRALSRDEQTDMGLVLIGRIAPGYDLGNTTPVHGSYALEDIPTLAARYGVTHWLIPSIWPETFSYTVHECLATGLPVLAFDLGAQGDAVRLAENGILLPWHRDQTDPDHLAHLILSAVSAPQED